MSYPNEFQLPRTRARNVIICGAGMKGLKVKPLHSGAPIGHLAKIIMIQK